MMSGWGGSQSENGDSERMVLTERAEAAGVMENGRSREQVRSSQRDIALGHCVLAKTRRSKKWGVGVCKTGKVFLASGRRLEQTSR